MSMRWIICWMLGLLAAVPLPSAEPVSLSATPAAAPSTAASSAPAPTDVVPTSDPYAAWSQGRPSDSLQQLVARAKDTDHWDAWYDAGLAAHAAGDKGQAAAFLLRAHKRNPVADGPRVALRQMDVPLPETWVERAGPLGLPGRGWLGVGLSALAGLALGYGVARWQNGRFKRRGLLVVGIAVALAIAPGVLAIVSDARQPWVAVIHDTQAMDSTGAPLRPLAAGTLVRREQENAWAGRDVVRLLDGTLVLVASKDVE
jgi:hypothetical protein